MRISLNKLFQALLFAAGTLLAAACAQPADSDRECIGGANTCGPILVETGSVGEGASNSTVGFSCAVTATPNSIMEGETVSLGIVTSGGEGTKTIRDSSGSSIAQFATQTSLTGTYSTTLDSEIIERTVYVFDENGDEATCSFQVQVCGIL